VKCFREKFTLRYKSCQILVKGVDKYLRPINVNTCDAEKGNIDGHFNTYVHV
jgi:hypothetical protein